MTFTQAQFDNAKLAGASTTTISSNGNQMRSSSLSVSGATPVVSMPTTVSQSL